MQMKNWLFACALVCLSLNLRGQEGENQRAANVKNILANAGFENLRTAERNDTLYIGLENRAWRWAPRALAEILKLVMPVAGSGEVVAVTFLRTGIPVTTIAISQGQYNRLLSGQLTPSGFADSISAGLSAGAYRSALGHIRPANRSYNKFDIVVYPQLRVQFGNFVHPLEARFNVVPSVEVSFLKGMKLTAQVINNLAGDPQGNTVRPGLVVLSQTFRLPGQLFTTVSAGYFTRDRYGITGEARKYLFNGKMSVGANLGYTGQMQLTEGYFTYTPANLFTWFCDASWRFAKYDLTIHGGYGGFIGRDRGWRVDIGRQFGEVTIGFFALKTGGVVNGGFNFIIPLPPRKYGTKNRVRIRPAPYVSWEYRAKGLPSTGRTYETGNSSNETMFNLNPDYLRTMIGPQILR
jgi:hypothetical protein